MLPKSYGRPAAHRVLSTPLWIPTVSSPHSRRTFSFTAKPRLPAPLTGAAVNELRPAPGSAVDPLKQLAPVSRCPLSVPFREFRDEIFLRFRLQVQYRSVSRVNAQHGFHLGSTVHCQ